MKADTGKTKYILLGLIAHEPRSGYAIKQAIEQQFKFFWQESYGQIYPALKRLESEGLIEAFAQDQGTESLRKVNCYRATEGGMAVLSSWLQEPAADEKHRLEILLKVYFSDALTPEGIIAHLETFKLRNQLKLDEINGYLSFFTNDRANGLKFGDHTSVELTVLCGKYQYEAYLNWAVEAKKIIQERKGITL